MNVLGLFLVMVFVVVSGLMLYAILRVSGICDDEEEAERWNR